MFLLTYRGRVRAGSRLWTSCCMRASTCRRSESPPLSPSRCFSLSFCLSLSRARARALSLSLSQLPASLRTTDLLRWHSGQTAVSGGLRTATVNTFRSDMFTIHMRLIIIEIPHSLAFQVELSTHSRRWQSPCMLPAAFPAKPQASSRTLVTRLVL